MSIIQAILASIGSGAPGAPATISVYGYSNPMDEGQTNTAYIQYENYPSTIIYWQIFNDTTNTLDWGGNINPAGFLVIEGTGQQSFSWTTTADMATEGSQNYYLQVGTTSGGTDILNQYLTINDTSVPPKANFTVEWWQKVENNGQNSRPWSIGFYPTQVIAVSYEGQSSDYYWINGSPVGNVAQSHAGAGWQHMAFVRNNGVVKGYLNGTEYFSANNNSAITDTTTPLYVGTGELGAGMYQGYIKDLHIIKGYAKYTGNFSVPTAPIQSQTGSVFLLSATDDGTKYVDSVGSKTASVTGTVAWSSDSPFTAYGPYTQYANTWGSGGGNWTIDFSGGNYNADLLNVKAGWTVSDGSGVRGTVVSNALDFGGTIRITVNFDPAGAGTWTFTQPAVGGSLYFNSSSYLNFGGSADWAMDV